ncbi:glycosyltransferase family 4 protein [Carboxylicivirga sp. M1479]|uniref:glycosyltransferase family 4 protein n=1 Tax=Carboxylicivirga sp. M1479 TaxID=2594476 RepID=UPI001177E97B|nr:glycosyltransferase [Carboxylicivirga sp. M1479]TRX70560.1 glycosyltransferase [Carboxylicivirga sp. M1479]
MQKTRILIFIDWFLPGYKAGGPVRSMANMVEYLKEEYEFYIVTRNTDYTETTPYDTVKSNCWEEYVEGVKVFYSDVAHQNKHSFKQLISEVAPEVIYINGVYSWKFSILPLMIAKALKNQKVIVASRGMLAPSAIDVKGGKKRLFLKLAKLAGLYKKVVFHATNTKEENDIKEVLGARSNVSIADNLPKRNLPSTKTIEKEPGQLKLVSLARIAPEKNTLFALERLAELEAFKGTISFDLYGQIYNEEYWQQCKAVMDQLPENIRVEHKGTVEADLVGTTIQDYHALYMPTRGENFGHVILESLSAGRPVLISDQTPWRELEKDKCGWDISLESIARSPKSNDEHGERREESSMSEARSSKSGGSAWCQVLSALVEMEQPEFNEWCKGARKRAEGFVNNSKLKEQYRRLLGR